MKNIFIYLLFFFLGINYYIIESKDYTIEFDGKTESFLTMEKVNEISLLTINVLNIPNYIKLFVNGEEEINYVISVFSDEKREERIQLAQSIYKSTTLYLNKNQFESKKLFIDIECSSIPCSYKFSISSQEKINLEENEQLSYYVTEKNINMEFSINIKSEKANIWTRGDRKILNSLTKFIKKSKNGNYFIVNKEKVEFTITGTVGDIINVGSIGFNGETSNENFIVDENTLTLFLSKTIFPQACFTFKLRENVTENHMVFLEGIINTKILQMNYLKDQNLTKTIFSNGKFSQEFNTINLNISKFCFTFPDKEKFPQFSNIEEIILNFHATLGKTSKNGLNFYEPQINGILYQRNLIKGEKLAFIGFKPEKDYKEINFNLFSLSGFPNMTIYDCDNYPLCLYKEGTLKNGVSPRNIDQFTTYSIYTSELKVEYNPISKKQKLLVVECNPGNLFLINFCKFDTLIYSNEDAINIPENQNINQYLLEGEKDNFRISFSGESKITEVNIDIIVYVGDIEIISNSSDGNKYERYHSSNKYFIKVTLGKESEKLDDLFLKVNAKKDSYYTILINFIRNEEGSSITNYLLSGINYLVTIDPLNKGIDGKSKKIIKIKNENTDDLLPFLTNFNSLNCKLDIYKKLNAQEEKYSSINEYDNCAEDVISWASERYQDDYYEYRIQIKEEDFSSYNGKLCMLYVSSIEINKQHEIYGRDIVIPDNIPQQIIFKKEVKHISYSYVQVDNEDDLIIKFNVKNKAQYLVKFFYEYKEGKNYTIESSTAIYLKHSEWKNECPEKDELCYIIIDINLEKTKDIEEPALELSVKSVDSDTTVYLPKNILKFDYIKNKVIQHYYTEVGQNENGFILANFLTTSGNIFARLVKKNSLEPEKDADWEGKYKFPKSSEESLPYDSLTKKINFNTKELICENGCYLLISCQSNEESNKEILNLPFSIIIQSSPSDKSNYSIPPIKIGKDEFIIGNTEILKDDNIKDFYSFLIDHDVEQIIIDLQGESISLLINVGSSKPNITNFDFKFSVDGKDSIIRISKKDIILKIKEKDSSLEIKSIKNVFLTFGVYANSINSVYTTIYSFMIHLELTPQNFIQIIKPEIKSICDTSANLYDTNYPYRCLYIAKYDFIGELNNLLLYPNLKDKSTNYQIYADFIDSSLFEMGSQLDIEEKIPTKNSEFSTDKTKLNYLYISNGLNDEKYLLINIVTTKNTRIEFMSSFNRNLVSITPSSVNPHLFMIKNNDLLSLDFQNESEKILKIDLESIGGNAEIYWEDTTNKYYLQGEEDKLSLSSPKGNKKKLIIKNSEQKFKNDDNFGFLFYLSYTIKNQKNIDELIIGKSVNFVYSENDFPIILYSRLDNSDKDLEIFFTFYETENGNNNIDYNIPQIKASALLVKEKTINDIRSNVEESVDLENAVQFIYDRALKTGFVRLTKSQLKKFNIAQDDKPNLFIKLEKTDNKQVFKKINIEVTVNQEDALISLNENIYQFGVLLESETKKEYKLKTDLNKKYLIIELSSINDNILFNLTNESGDKVFEKNEPEKNKNGLKSYKFKIDSGLNKYIKLIFYRNNNNNDKIYFTFKYDNINEDNNYDKYVVENDVINVERKKSKKGINYKINLEPIKNSDNLNINYIANIITTKNNTIPKQSIVLSDDEKQFVKEFNNILPSNGKIVLEINDVEGISTYIKVVAQIKDKNINEFLSYKYYELPQDEPPEEESSNFVIIIIIIVIILIMIILIAVIFVIRRKKNRNLTNDINQIEGTSGLLDNKEKKSYELN